jgi:pyruvate formate lyase activating enzyme
MKGLCSCKVNTWVKSIPMSSVVIFNVQRFSLHDGPGIRTTVFFKGCPLKCRWCHNPEGLSNEIEFLHNKDKCSLCAECVKRCPSHAISIIDETIVTDMSKCSLCGECSYYCVNGLRETAGKEYSADELMKIILKDRIFFEESGGGVTLSGGEPVMQIDFIEELLKRLKSENIHTAVDTSGIMPLEYYERIYKYTDLFLYDIKLVDEDKHKIFTGCSNDIIIENLKKLSNLYSNANAESSIENTITNKDNINVRNDTYRGINLRLPIIEGVNADDEHIDKVVELIKCLGIKNINLLPYHNISEHKYKNLNKQYQSDGMSVPSDDKMNSFKSKLENIGYIVKIGG